MLSRVKVLREGMMMSFQDGGRMGWYGAGVPRSGVLDGFLWRLGNRVLGHEGGEVALEFFYRGPVLEVIEGGVCMVLSGCVGGEVKRVGGEREGVSAWESFYVGEGDCVVVGDVREGCVGYVMVEGGWCVDKVLGSGSFYGRAGLGREVGEELEVRGGMRSLGRRCVGRRGGVRKRVRVMWGPQDDYFSEEERLGFLSRDFEVDMTRDRMGIRLRGHSVKSCRGYDVVSEGLVPGAIQVSGNGYPIVLLNDCQTMGGYPKIATVISADMHHVGQWTGGDKVGFEVVNEEEAYEALRVLKEEEEGMKVLMKGGSFMGENLVGGVVDGLRPDHFPGHLLGTFVLGGREERVVDMKKVDVNADMGEGYGVYKVGEDEILLESVSSANVACGFHGGDPLVMRKTVRMAVARGVCIGAHPSFLDRHGFGRREMTLGREELESWVWYQLGALEGVVRGEGGELKYVKPHGAMNTMASKDEDMARVIGEAVRDYNEGLMMLVPLGSCLERVCRDLGMRVGCEIFADRGYGVDGFLLPRGEEGALIGDVERSVEQVLGMLERGGVDSICVHGDGDMAVVLVRGLCKALEEEGYGIAGLDEVVD